MRILFIAAFAVAGLAACNTSDRAATEPDTTVAFAGPIEEPHPSLVAEELVGRWSSPNGNYVEFDADGIVTVSGRDRLEMSYRVLGDSLVVADSVAILDVEAIPAANRYYIESLTATGLVLAPAGGTLGGSYSRDDLPSGLADTTMRR